MDVSLQRRLAAEILNVGEDRVWIDPTKLEDVKKAITREDVRQLINKGIIKKLPIEGQSRYWANYRREKRKKGRMRGYGSRKGSKDARLDSKELWIRRVRAQRRFIRILLNKGLIDKKIYRKVYLMIKSGQFKSKKAILSYLQENKLLKS